MRSRLVTVLILAGLVLTVSLVTYARLSARDIVVPAVCKPSTPEESCLRAVGATDALPVSKVPTVMVNTRRIRLNYSVSEVGPSGVSAIELWATRDGRSWARYSNEPPPEGPLVVHVAEEGRYGFTIVVKSGVGLTSPAPQPGDAPQLWVEVDETRPTVRLRDVHLGKGIEAGTLTISWSATDSNLLAKPITISTSAKKEGPYVPVVSCLENDGKYVWQMPKDLPYQFYVRVEANDMAGNVGHACSAEPVRVDLSRPKGTILGVDGEKKVTKIPARRGESEPIYTLDAPATDVPPATPSRDR